MSRAHRVLLAGALLAALPALPARAEPAPPVRVRFEVEAAALEQHWGDSAAQLKREIETGLVGVLAGALPHWEYEEAGAAASGERAELRFRVVQEVAPALAFAVELHRPGLSPPPRLQVPWLSRSDLMIAGYPPPATATAETLAPLRDLVGKHEPTLREWLSEHVAIGVGAHWLERAAQPPRLVVGLPWSRYVNLSESVFRVACRWPGHGTAWLESVGPGLSAPFQPPAPQPSPTPPFEGLVVVARQRVFAGDPLPVENVGVEIFELEPALVFLKSYRPRTDWNIGGTP